MLHKILETCPTVSEQLAKCRSKNRTYSAWSSLMWSSLAQFLCFCCWITRYRCFQLPTLPETQHGPPTNKKTHPGLAHMASFYLHMLISSWCRYAHKWIRNLPGLLLETNGSRPYCYLGRFYFDSVCFLTSRQSAVSQKDQQFSSAMFTLGVVWFSSVPFKVRFVPYHVNVTSLQNTIRVQKIPVRMPPLKIQLIYWVCV